MKRVVAETSIEAARRGADAIERLVAAIPVGKGYFTLVLSGGTSPEALYNALSCRRIDWKNVHLFWGDERCVGPDSVESNYRMARRALIDRIDIPAGNIHRIEAERGAEGAAAYVEETARFFALKPGHIPAFDLLLLGMGGDGHTASLFPGEEALKSDTPFVHVSRPPLDRITATFSVMRHARNIHLHITGEGKADMLRRVLEGEPDLDRYPAQIVREAAGSVELYADRAAAALLSPEGE